MKPLSERARYLLDSDDRNIWDEDAGIEANHCLSRFIDSVKQGRTDFPDADELCFSCSVLAGLGDICQDAATRRLIGLLDDPRGVRFSVVYPLVVEFQRYANTAISKADSRGASQNSPDLF